jgi:hypothetical protein
MLDSVSLFRYLSFLLAFAPAHPSEKALLQRFARIGVGAGKPFDETELSPEINAALDVA